MGGNLGRFFLLILFLSLGLLSATAQAGEPVVLREGWEYRWGDPGLQGEPVSSWLTEPGLSSPDWKPQTTFPGPAPGRNGEKNLWQRVRLPRTPFENPSLYVLGVDQNMEVFLDGEFLYRFGPLDAKGNGRFEGYPWHIIPLPNNSAGRLLSFRIWADHVNIGLIGDVKIGQDGDFISSMVRHSSNSILVAIVVAFIGLVSLLMFALKSSQREYLAFGIFSICIGFYVFSRTEVKQFLVTGNLARVHLELATLYFSAYSMTAFVDCVFEKVIGRTMRWAARIYLGACVVASVLLFSEAINPMATLMPMQIFILGLILLGMSLVIRRAFTGDQEARFIILGFAFFFSAAVLDILIALGVVLPQLQGALGFTPWGILALIACFAWVLISRFIAVYRSVLEHKESLELLATEGRKIGAKSTFGDLLQQIRESFATVARFPLRLKVFFHRAAFADRNLPDGFFLMSDDGQVADPVPRAAEQVRQEGRGTILVTDLRGIDPLAVIPLEHGAGTGKNPELEQKLLDKALALLEPLTNNVASAINTVKLEQTFGMLERRTQEIRTIFGHINQGILMIDQSLRILPEYSAHMHEIFGTRAIAGQDFLELAFAEAEISGDVRSQIRTCLAGAIGEDALNWECNNDVLPREVRRGGRWLEIDWTAIVAPNDVVHRLMVTFRDVTTLKALKAAAEANRLEMEMLHQIVSVAPDKFEGFLSSGRRYLEDSRALLRKPGGPCDEDLNEVKRNLHTVKGNSRTLRLTHLTTLAHEVESAVIEILKGGNAPADALLGELERLAEMLSRYESIARERLGRGDGSRDVQEVVEDVIALARRVSEAQELNDAMRTELRQVHLRLVRLGAPTLHGVVSGIAPSMDGLADELGRPHPTVAMECTEDWVLGTDFAEALQGSLTHLMRNSLDHGFLDNRKGTIFLSGEIQGSEGLLVYRDTGAGLNLARLLEKAIERGLAQRGCSDEELAELVFVSGISTAERVTDVSGRGVGMDAVRSLMRKVGASVSLEFTAMRSVDDRRAFRVVIRFPAAHVKDRVALS